jgi:hypothetical protein
VAQVVRDLGAYGTASERANAQAAASFSIKSLEQTIDAERDPVRLPLLRKQLAAGTSRLAEMKVATMAGEAPPA